MRPIFALALAASLATSLAGISHAQVQDKVTYQYSWLPTGEYAPYSVGMAKGFYKEVGIDLQVATGRGSGDAVKKVAGGAAMFGDGDISAVMAARAQEKAPVKCVMAQHVQSPHSLFVLESSGIKSFKDLAGKTLATTPGNSHYLYFPLVAKLAGLDPASVKWVTVDASAMAPMLIAGRVDDAPLFATHLYYQNKEAQKYGKTIKAIPFAEAGFKIYSYCIYTREDVMAQSPDLVRRFVAATAKSFLWAKDHIEEAAAIHHARFPDVDEDDAKGSMRILFTYMFDDATERDGFGAFNKDRLADTYRAVSQAQNLPPDADINQFVDMRFLPAKSTQ